MSNNAALLDSISGAAGALAALLCTYPLLTVSTQQAVRSDADKTASSSVLQDIIKARCCGSPVALWQSPAPPPQHVGSPAHAACASTSRSPPSDHHAS